MKAGIRWHQDTNNGDSGGKIVIIKVINAKREWIERVDNGLWLINMQVVIKLLMLFRNIYIYMLRGPLPYPLIISFDDFIAFLDGEI